MAFTCPYATRLKSINDGLACTKIMRIGIDYNKTENALTAFCACQRYCTIERRNINTDKAKECYEYHFNLTND